MKLTEYLNPDTLQHLQDAFAAVARVAIRICDAEGQPLTDPSDANPPRSEMPGSVSEIEPDHANAPIMVNDRIIGRVKFDATDETAISPRHLRLVGLVTGVIARLCQRESQLRTRVDELATLYKLTGEFNSRRDLDSLMDLVVSTVVEAVGAKACAIRLLNEEGTELVIEAVENLSAEYLNKGAILLEESRIDQEVFETGEPVYIEDLGSDPRVLYPTEAQREGIVSGLCVPMIYKSRPEGAIRVYMSELHEFDWFEISLIKAIAAEAASAIVNARLYSQAVQAANIQRQLRLAGEVQRRMIPDELPDVEGLEIATIYVPCFELGGDFYDFIDLPDDNLGVVVCDVVGKGVRASLMMASIRASLRAHAASVYDMSQVLSRVNRDLCSGTFTSDFATLFYGVIDLKTRRLTYSSAGHTPPLLIRNGEIRHLECGGSVLGLDVDMTWPHEAVQLQSGDVLLAYTDGLNEAMNFDDEPFGRKRVEAAALDAIGQARRVEGIAKHILWEMRRFAGLQTRPDDLTLVAIQAE